MVIDWFIPSYKKGRDKMTIEQELKQYILDRYGSVREFVAHTDLPYMTVDNMLKRGLRRTTVSNVIRVCKVLGISADALAEDRIEPKGQKKTIPLEEYIDDFRRAAPTLTLDNLPLTPDELKTIWNALDVGIGMVKNGRTVR